MNWTVWVIGGVLVAMVVIGAAWWASEQRRVETWRRYNREHLDPMPGARAGPADPGPKSSDRDDRADRDGVR